MTLDDVIGFIFIVVWIVPVLVGFLIGAYQALFTNH